MKYEIQVKIDGAWRLAHAANKFTVYNASLGETQSIMVRRAEALLSKFSEVRIVKNRWFRDPVEIWYTNVSTNP